MTCQRSKCFIVLLAAVSTTAILFSGCSGSSPGVSSAPRLAPRADVVAEVPQELVREATEIVAERTQVKPTSVTVYKSTLANAELASSGSIEESDEPVYMFSFPGDFTDHAAFGTPPDKGDTVAEPTGTVAVVVLSSDGSLRAWSLSNQAVDDKIVSPVATLDIA